MKIDSTNGVLGSVRRIGFSLLSLVLCTSALTACDDSDDSTEVPDYPSSGSVVRLESPTLAVKEIDVDSAVITWSSVEGAGAYHVVVTDTDKNTITDRTFESLNSLPLENLTANTTYVVYCMALAADPAVNSNSEIGTTRFTTAYPEQSFEISVSNVTESTAEVTVIPAVKDQYYRIIAFREDLPDDVVLKMMIDDVTAYVNAKGWETSIEEGLFFIGDTYNCEFNQFPDGYDARFFVVGFDYRDGAVVATTGLFKSEKFTTIEIVESEAWANMSPEYILGDTYPIMKVNFSPNAHVKQIKAALWNVYTGYGDPTSLAQSGYTEEGIRGALLSRDDVEDIDMTDPYIASYIQPGTALLFGAVALDETGTPGKTNWIILKAVSEEEGGFKILCEAQDNISGQGVSEPDLSVEYTFADASAIDPQYEGCVQVKLTFSPNSLCADYHFSFEDPGTYDSYTGAFASIYLMSDMYKYNETNGYGWYERADTQNDSFSTVLAPYYTGQSVELMYVCIQSDGSFPDAKYVSLEVPVFISSASVSVSGKTVGHSGRCRPVDAMKPSLRAFGLQ